MGKRLRLGLPLVASMLLLGLVSGCGGQAKQALPAPTRPGTAECPPVGSSLPPLTVAIARQGIGKQLARCSRLPSGALIRGTYHYPAAMAQVLGVDGVRLPVTIDLNPGSKLGSHHTVCYADPAALWEIELNGTWYLARSLACPMDF